MYIDNRLTPHCDTCEQLEVVAEEESVYCDGVPCSRTVIVDCANRNTCYELYTRAVDDCGQYWSALGASKEQIETLKHELLKEC